MIDWIGGLGWATYEHWLYGAIIITTSFMFAKFGWQSIKGIRAGERLLSPYLRLVVSLTLHATGVILIAVGRLWVGVPLIVAGLTIVAASKTLMLFTDKDEEKDRTVWWAMVACLGLWTVLVLWGIV